MSTIKNRLQKLIFILPMLAIMLTLTGFTKNIYGERINKKNNTSFSFNKKFDIYTFLVADENELVYNEAEKSEFETELIWISFYSFRDAFLNIKLTSENNLHPINIHVANQKFHLYDLFCDWKLHFI